MNPINYFLVAFAGFFLGWLWYIVWESFRRGLEEAQYMEKQFGRDVRAAAAWKFGIRKRK